jgi:hypothetical protein
VYPAANPINNPRMSVIASGNMAGLERSTTLTLRTSSSGAADASIACT